MDQVVIVGAGFDTRAYRIPGIDRARVFEIDLPRLQERKLKAIDALFEARLPMVEYLSVDFETQDLADALRSHGMDFSRPAFFVWEGVTQYLRATAVG